MNDRERQAREKLRKEIEADILVGRDIPTHGIYPGLGERWGRPIEAQEAITIPERHFIAIATKIVKGIFLLETGRHVEPPYQVGFHAIDDRGSLEIRSALDQHGVIYERPPGVLIRCAITPDDGVSGLFEIVLWRLIRLYASITESDDGDKTTSR